MANISSQQSVPIGFVLRPSEQPFNNPYVTQEAHNPPYKPTSYYISHNTTQHTHGNRQNGEGHRIEDGFVWSTPTQTYYTNIRTIQKFIIGIASFFVLITVIMIILFMFA